jgi:hypothetical protein
MDVVLHGFRHGLTGSTTAKSALDEEYIAKVLRIVNLVIDLLIYLIKHATSRTYLASQLPQQVDLALFVFRRGAFVDLLSVHDACDLALNRAA